MYLLSHMVCQETPLLHYNSWNSCAMLEAVWPMQCALFFRLLLKDSMHRPHRAAYLDFWSALHRATTNKHKMEKHDVIKILVMFSYFCCYCWDHCWVGIWYPEVYTEMVLFSGPTKFTGRKLTAVQWRKLEEIDPVGYPHFFNNGPKLPICKILLKKLSSSNLFYLWKAYPKP